MLAAPAQSVLSSSMRRKEAIAVIVLSAITGSASGGLSIALKTVGETYYERALAVGIDPQWLHVLPRCPVGDSIVCRTMVPS